MTVKSIKYGIIILAAGSSSRLGRPKQLLKHQQGSMVLHVATQAKAVENTLTMVVIGAARELVDIALFDAKVQTCYNPDWGQGMSTSIRTGLHAILQLAPEIEGCILCVCDQPYITTAVFLDLIRAFEKSDGEIIASSYNNTVGTPVIFGAKYFTALMDLSGQEGAKKLLTKYETNVRLLPFPNGEVDIDTEDDYVRFISACK
jgi:molybdenum cofactor cytidylyltransferase